MCAVNGPAGEKEIAGLIGFAAAGWNIAFMDLDKHAGERLRKKLSDEYNIRVKVINNKNDDDMEAFDIEGFFYHGDWNDEEDSDIFWGFLIGQYETVDHVINKV